MVNKKIYLIGLITVILLASCVAYFQYEGVKFRIDQDKTTIYYLENSRWKVSGVETNSLWVATSKLNRDLFKCKLIDKIGENNKSWTRYRITKYKRGPTLIDEYLFVGNINDISLIPKTHKITILNASGFIYKYEVQRLGYSGETKKLDGIYLMGFKHDVKVEWDKRNYYSKVYKYKNKDEGKLTIKYKIKSDNVSFYNRVYDPASFSINLNSPAINETITNATPSFNFTVSGDQGFYVCDLIINESYLYGPASEGVNNYLTTFSTGASAVNLSFTNYEDEHYLYLKLYKNFKVLNGSFDISGEPDWNTNDFFSTSVSGDLDDISYSGDQDINTYAYDSGSGSAFRYDYSSFNYSSYNITIYKINFKYYISALDTGTSGDDYRYRVSLYGTRKNSAGNWVWWGNPIDDIYSDDTSTATISSGTSVSGELSDFYNRIIETKKEYDPEDSEAPGEYEIRDYEEWLTLKLYPTHLEIDGPNWNTLFNSVPSYSSTISVDLNTAEINSALSTCSPDSEGFCLLQLYFIGGYGGYVEVSNLNVTYLNNSIPNNVSTIIVANQSLANGNYNWSINCSGGDSENASSLRPFTILVNSCDNCDGTSNCIWDCSDSCNITSNINMNDYNITLNQSKSGNYITSIQANVTNLGTLIKSDYNSSNICLLSIKNGNNFG